MEPGGGQTGMIILLKQEDFVIEKDKGFYKYAAKSSSELALTELHVLWIQLV